ncbi:hypothetical protein TNCT_301351 [Trichonephila clavata]|uniref:Uncharacterized protein n=1 Tax=Trichonephila clavata TaxID=2740835 RepID=A0A8X6JFB8_TRICU|nr:hypothetical protein TNCT_301351 [Trichonephila clavata]
MKRTLENTINRKKVTDSSKDGIFCCANIITRERKQPLSRRTGPNFRPSVVRNEETLDKRINRKEVTASSKDGIFCCGQTLSRETEKDPFREELV